MQVSLLLSAFLSTLPPLSVSFLSQLVLYWHQTSAITLSGTSVSVHACTQTHKQVRREGDVEERALTHVLGVKAMLCSVSCPLPSPFL